MISLSNCFSDTFLFNFFSVSHSCGDLATDGDSAAVNASVTIQSDLHAMGHLKCKGDLSYQRRNVDMDPIDDDSTQSTTSIYYPGEILPSMESCIFFVS